MDNTAREGFKQSPVLVDKVIQALRQNIASKLDWLDTTFGRSYDMVEHEDDGGKFIYPAAYIGDGEYTSLLPNDRFGNFLWFDVYDPQDITTVRQQLAQIEFNCAAVFWFNQEKIFDASDFLYIEEIKDQILRALSSPGMVKYGETLTVSRIYEKPENIYKGYSLEKLYNSHLYKGQNIQAMDHQYFVHPYGALRFELNITARETCYK